MRQLLLTMTMASSAVYATSTTFTSCTVGTMIVRPCPGNFLLTTGLSGPNYFASAFAATGPDTGQRFAALAEATAFYTGPLSRPPLLAISATAEASDDITGYTRGPSRAGFIDLTMSEGASTPYGGFGSVSITDGVHTYVPVCTHPVIFCLYNATLPFDLGTKFQILESASATTSITPSFGFFGSGEGGLATLNFTLLASDGTTSVPFSVVPEPSTCSLLLLGFAGATSFLKKVRPLRLGHLSSSISPRT